MNNIFENAFFGKAYKTRDERKVIYCGTFENNSLFNTKVVINTDVDQASDYIDFRWYTQEGKSSIADSPNDIVSEWQEINEKELDELAYRWAYNISGTSVKWELLQEAYKAGYRKAKEN